MAAGAGAGHESSTPQVETRMVVEYGITVDGVWLPLSLIRRLEEHGPWSATCSELPRRARRCYGPSP